MKKRNRQRENRRLKDAGLLESTRTEKPWLNHEGYHDPTAYQAIRNVERQEHRNAVMQHRLVTQHQIIAAVNP